MDIPRLTLAIQEARYWLLDCEWADLTQEDISWLSPEEVIQGVHRNYCGGWQQFLLDGE